MKTAVMKSEAKRFGELVQAGIDSWMEAGALLVRKTGEDPQFPNYVLKANPHITKETLDGFMRIGKGQVNVRLLLSEGRPGVKALLNLPRPLQDEYETKPVTVGVAQGKTWKTVTVPVRDLTGPQANQVFGGGTIRSVKEQKEWMSAKLKKDPAPWIVQGNKVLIKRRGYFGVRELQKMLGELTEEGGKRRTLRLTAVAA